MRIPLRLAVTGLAVLVAAGVLALLAFGVFAQKTDSSIDAQVAAHKYPLAPGQTMALPMLGSDRTRDLADYRGKVVVVNVYASWCDPCKTEAPLLASEQKLLAGHDATVLGITHLDNSSAAQTFNRRYGVTYPVLRDVNGNFGNAYGVKGVPETFVINREGHIQAVRRYQVSQQWLARTLKPILAERSPGTVQSAARNASATTAGAGS